MKVLEFDYKCGDLVSSLVPELPRSRHASLCNTLNFADPDPLTYPDSSGRTDLAHWIKEKQIYRAKIIIHAKTP